MALGVWASRARLLFPSPDTLPKSWGDWRDMFGNIILKPWMNMEESTTGDVNPLRVRYELQPCRVCSQAINVPPPVYLRSAGVHAEWWEPWNPSTQANQYPGGRELSAN